MKKYFLKANNLRSAKVVGTVVSTVKNESLSGIKLLVTELLDGERSYIVAADATGQAGVGDYVYVIQSKEAGLILRCGDVPSDASICGFIDSYNDFKSASK